MDPFVAFSSTGVWMKSTGKTATKLKYLRRSAALELRQILLNTLNYKPLGILFGKIAASILNRYTESEELNRACIPKCRYAKFLLHVDHIKGEKQWLRQFITSERRKYCPSLMA